MAKARRINGRPMSHWKREGDKLVINVLVRAAFDYGWGGPEPAPTQSAIHFFAGNKLMDMAKALDPDEVKRQIEERDRCISALAAFMNGFVKEGNDE